MRSRSPFKKSTRIKPNLPCNGLLLTSDVSNNHCFKFSEKSDREASELINNWAYFLTLT